MGLPRWLGGGGDTRPRTPTSQKQRLQPNPNNPVLPPYADPGLTRDERIATLGPDPTLEARYRAIRFKPSLTPDLNARLAQERLAATNPPPLPEEAESTAVEKAKRLAMRVRRRGRAGNAGRVTTGTGATPGVGAGGTARSLIGY